MDPVTLVVLCVVALAIAPKAIGLGLYGAMHAVQKIKKVFKEHKAYRQRHNKKYQEKSRRTRELKRSIERNRTVAFKNIKTGAIKNVNINECNTFDMQNDVILKGKVYIQNPNGGEPAVDTIYLFQPRLYGVNNVQIGPKLDKNGHLYDKHSYLLRTPGSSDIYSGYVPRREVLTGRQFDYVSDSFNAQEDPLSNFIKIELEKDEKGNFIPLDKNNVAQMNEFKKYVELRQKHNIDQDRYLDGLLAKASEAKEAYDKATKPHYAKPTNQPSREDMQRVENARASRAKKDAQNRAYYDRIAHMNMLDSAMHNYGLDDHAQHIGVPGMGMPMGPMPPGPPPSSGPTGGGRRR